MGIKERKQRQKDLRRQQIFVAANMINLFSHENLDRRSPEVLNQFRDLLKSMFEKLNII